MREDNRNNTFNWLALALRCRSKNELLISEISNAFYRLNQRTEVKLNLSAHK